MQLRAWAGFLNSFFQFFLREDDVGKSRAEATVGRLAELNAYVPVRNLGGAAGQELSVELIKGFQVNYSGVRFGLTSFHHSTGRGTMRSILPQADRNQ
jgi:molybdopterin/thiamine biosynthesis adenylyltransferase